MPLLRDDRQGQSRNGNKQAGSSNYMIPHNGKPVKEMRTAIKTPHGKAGVDKEVIKAVTGHTTYVMFPRYNKIDDEDMDIAASKFEAFLTNKKQTGVSGVLYGVFP